jgi:DNA polymerase-1
MTENTNKPLILIDGSSYFYRAFYALPPLTNSKGNPTGAIYGVLNMIRKLLKDYQPDYAAVIFDAKGKTFRDELFENYKATRAPMPSELVDQINPLQEVLLAMGLPLLIIEGVEADDVIGTLALQAEKQGLPTLISTGDKDMAQLVNDQITLINTMSNTILDREGVITKFGIPPELIVDYLALVGDNIDNIPGIPKVGPKTAVKWLTQFGSLDNIVANADKISGVVGENLRNHLQNLQLSRQLATLRLDVPLEKNLTDLKPQLPQKERLIEIYRELEFRSLLAELLEEVPTENNTVKTDYETIITQQQFNGWLEKLKKAELISFDIETTSLDYIDAEIVGVSFAIETNKAAYLPLKHDYAGAPPQLHREEILATLKPLLEDPHIKKLGHNLKYDMSVLSNYAIHLQGITYDTMLESYILNSSGSRHDMNSLALKYLGYKTIHYEDVAGKGAKQIPFSQVSIEEATRYSAEDADVSLVLHQYLWPQIEKQQRLMQVFHEIEIPLISVLSRMECHGVLIDEKKLAAQSTELAKRLLVLELEAHNIATQPFNLSSPKQLQEILYQQLKLPVLQKTPTGQPSTSEEVLQELALDFPLPKIILEYRSLSKLKSTYTDALPKQINVKTGRVHTSYNQAVAATGRLSSTNPNLQNIPIRTEEGRKIRQAFIARKEYLIVAADYSQIELRIMAHLSQDKGLLNAFTHSLDIHQATAAEVLGISLETVTAEQRRSAKAVNFGLIYGMSAFGLSRQLGITPEMARNYIDTYFHRYPGVKAYMENTRELAHQQGYVETLFGRRLYLPEINNRNLQRQRAAERAAINAPMQGTAADIIKKAMIAVDHWLQHSKTDGNMIMQVHDELVFEVATDAVASFSAKIRDLMMNTVKITVPLIVDVGVGENWDEAH